MLQIHVLQQQAGVSRRYLLSRQLSTSTITRARFLQPNISRLREASAVRVFARMLGSTTSATDDQDGECMEEEGRLEHRVALVGSSGGGGATLGSTEELVVLVKEQLEHAGMQVHMTALF